MIRRTAFALLVILVASSAIIPFNLSHPTSSPPRVTQLAQLSDPLVSAAGSTTAFNLTYAMTDLYTNTSAGFLQSTPFKGNMTWFSSVNRTVDNAPIRGTDFKFNLTTSSPAFTPTIGSESINWTLPIPKGGCATCNLTIVRFDFPQPTFPSNHGNNASFAFYYASNKTLVKPPALSTLYCPQIALQRCFNATPWIGYNLTLSIRFAWNFTGAGLHVINAEFGELIVFSPNFGLTFVNSLSHTMTVGTASNNVTHTGNLSLSYNRNVSYANPLMLTQTLKHNWTSVIISYYYPSPYTIVQINATTPIYKPGSLGSPFAFDSGVCAQGPGIGCSGTYSTSFVSLNMTNNQVKGTVSINATSQNAVATIRTVIPTSPSGPVSPTAFWQLGETFGVQAVAGKLVGPGSFNLTFRDPNGGLNTILQQTFILTSTGGVFNFTIPGFAPPGNWTIFSTFSSLGCNPSGLKCLDLGARNTSFRVDQIQITTFSSGGGNTGLNVQGSLTYVSSSSAAIGTSGVVFAIDSGTPINIPVTNKTVSPSGGGLYISNITLYDPVFTQGQPLVMQFTIVNPTSPALAFNASVTIEHDWAGSQSHGLNFTFPLGTGDGFGDLPFISGPQAYQAALTLTARGVQVVLTSLSTQNSKSFMMSIGTDPIVPGRQSTGLFKISISSKAGTSTFPTNSLNSPPYAYVPGLPFVPGRLLAYSTPFKTDTSGSFSLTMKSDAILAAKKLVVFALAEDSSGTVLVNDPQKPSFFTDSTTLLSSMDAIGQVAENQKVTATLHLTSNSSKLTQTITINLVLQDSGTVASQTGVTLAPGASQTVTLSFNAPATPGQYALTFSSPQYAGPIATQTLQVTIIQGNLQVLIPAAIGVVAAIIILGLYLVRRQPEMEEREERTKPAGSKPKSPGSGNPPSKSLTRTQHPYW